MRRVRRFASVSLFATTLLAAQALPAEAHEWRDGKFIHCEFKVMNHGFGKYGENGMAFGFTHVAPPQSTYDGCIKHRTRVGNDCGWEYAWGAWGTSSQDSASSPGNVEDVANGCQWWSEHYLVLWSQQTETWCLRYNFGGYFIRSDATCAGVNAQYPPLPNPNCPNSLATVCRAVTGG